MKPAMGSLRVFDDVAALARGGADWVAELARRSSGRFVVALSGGSTPKPLYQHFAEEPIRSSFPWERAHWFLGDERFVPPSDPASNFGMICTAFLSHVPAPKQNVHPVPTEGLTLDEAAAQYETTLQLLYGAESLDASRPLFDLCLLGLGEDGHTASLIPGQPVLEERKLWVVGVGHGRPEPRITLTYPVLESSRAVAFLVAGESKRKILDDVLTGGSTVPAARLNPKGEVIWLIDRAAAGRWAT